MKHYRFKCVVFIRLFGMLALFVSMGGCASLMLTSVLAPTVENLQKQTDLELVCEGAPAFLLMIDSLLVSKPDNTEMLLAGTQAYAAYSEVLGECGRKERLGPLSAKARKYGLALLYGLPGLTLAQSIPLSQLEEALVNVGRGKIDSLFWGAYGWAVWVRGQGGSPAALVVLPRIERMMLRVLELDETYYYGASHLFLAVYYGSLPQQLGGKPKESRNHFERALDVSNRQFLPIQVAYAESYARLAFDRTLYENLLQEVLAFSLESRPEINLSNQLAKKRARRLLDEADLYF